MINIRKNAKSKTVKQHAGAVPVSLWLPKKDK